MIGPGVDIARRTKLLQFARPQVNFAVLHNQPRMEHMRAQVQVAHRIPGRHEPVAATRQFTAAAAIRGIFPSSTQTQQDFAEKLLEVDFLQCCFFYMAVK